MPLKTYFNWSTGKDSAMALNALLRDDRYSVAHLLTSVNAHHDRVSMHGVRTALLQRQVDAIGISALRIELPEQPTNEEYERLAGGKVAQLKAMGCEVAAFGDIFLEDLRRYREDQLATVGMKTVFPLWKRDTRELMAEFITSGFRAITVCVNASLLDRSFVGRELDRSFLDDLPVNVDPCGENGEFHTFCYYAPFFKEPVPFSIGETVYREYDNAGSKSGFWFCDLLPA
ncbi:diphthine--ammonia ligase [Nemorincola caseinilytica]|uniref:Diphthine--ammonia ligase n=1 Tax=Nemorincola caseinilytica TaxID=2054315 RepID=A0ABP8N8M8_9BACT